MQILFLAHRIPYPPDRGDRIRSWNILRHLCTLGTVHLGCFAEEKAELAQVAAMRELLGPGLGEVHVELRRTGKAAAAARAMLAGKPVSLTLFDSAGLRAFVGRTLERPGVETVFAFSGQMAQFVPEGTRLVMDFVDVDSAKFEAYAAQGGALAAVHRREARKLFAFEREVAARAAVSLFVSDSEAALFALRAGLPGADIRALHNGVDLDFYRPDAPFARIAPPVRPLIVFTGQMDYAPNVDAVAWFAGEILPRLPRAEFAIVGRSPTEAVKRLASDRVTVTGAVPDTRAWLAAASIVVAPLRIARGVQNKVLEAMAMGRPVVASPAAFEGIEAVPGRDLLVAESAAEQAQAVNGLLSDPGRATALGMAARRRMEEAYHWDARLAPLASIVGAAPARAAA